MRIWVWLVLALCALAAACQEGREGEAPGAASPVEVRITAVRRGDIAETISVTGETQALSLLRLASPVAGRITALSVFAGDHLGRGDVAARVLPLENEAAVHGFSVLAQAEALSPAERRRARQLRQDLNAREIPLESPFDAVVAERLHNPGEQVAAGDVLLELFNPTSLYVLAQVPAEQASRMHAGTAVEVSAGGQPLAGRVAAVITALAPQTLTVPVRIALAEPPQPPWLHAAVRCRITLTRHTGVLLIPRSALVSSTVGKTGVVMVASEGRARQRRVQLGLRGAGRVEITGGLSLGEAVLVDGQYGLPDGTPIRPVPSGGTPVS